MSGNRRKSSPKMSVPLMTDYGFGVDETGRIIHFKRDGSEEDEDEQLPHQKALESFQVTLHGKRVAGGCNRDENCNVVIDESEQGVAGHVGVKCLRHHTGWIVPKEATNAKG